MKEHSKICSAETKGKRVPSALPLSAEIWKDIKNYEGQYQVSSFGNIKGKLGNLKQRQDRYGYMMVSLKKSGIVKTFLVHLLVFDHFVGRERQKVSVDHIDNNKTNNFISNLQLLPIRKNVSKALLNKNAKTSKYTGVSWDRSKNKWRSCIQINGKTKHLGYFNSECAASNIYQQSLSGLYNG